MLEYFVYGDAYIFQVVNWHSNEYTNSCTVGHHMLFLAQKMMIPKYNGRSQMLLMVYYIDGIFATIFIT